MLKVDYVRNGKNQIVGTKTSGFANGDTVARDSNGKILGHANSTFNNTRDAHGHLVSTNSDDVALLFRQ
jgi:hypothetical protein